VALPRLCSENFPSRLPPKREALKRLFPVSRALFPAGQLVPGIVPGRPVLEPVMDVILHLGAHRTATTSLQAWMVQNEDALGAAGIAVWGPQITRSGLFAGLVKRPEWLNAADEAVARASRTAIRFEIDRLAEAGMRALVVSDENLLGMMGQCLEQETLYPDAGARLRRVIAAFGPHLSRLALSIRRTDLWWVSVLADQRRRGRPPLARQGIVRLANHPRGWRRIVETLREAGQGREITVWPFETLGGRNAAQMQAMLGRVALPCGLYDHGRAMNASAPAAAGLSPFTLREREALAARYLADLDWLAQAQPGVTFIDREKGQPEAEPAWPTEEEGKFHDQDERGLGEARAEGAA